MTLRIDKSRITHTHVEFFCGPYEFWHRLTFPGYLIEEEAIHAAKEFLQRGNPGLIDFDDCIPEFFVGWHTAFDAAQTADLTSTWLPF